MLIRQDLVLCRAVRDRIAVSQARKVAQGRAKLPKLIHRNATVQHSLLPRLLAGQMTTGAGAGTILLENDGLSSFRTSVVVLLNPS